MNPYLPKVLENLGALVYDEIENEGQTCFSINSVVSSHGEHLVLKQVNRKYPTFVTGIPSAHLEILGFPMGSAY